MAILAILAIRRIALIALAVVAVIAVLAYLALGAFLPWREDAEAERLAEILGVKPGGTVADVGAGSGRFSVKMAAIVGPSGKVYSTELNSENLQAIAARAQAAGVGNVLPIEGAELETKLPDACCDAVFLRNVYHHITDPDAFASSLRKAVRPGGRLGVIDFAPGALWFPISRPAEASERRSGHGVSLDEARAELTKAGFQVEQELPDWSGPMWLIVFSSGPRPPAPVP